MLMLRLPFHVRRPGTTLVELLIFLAIIAVTAAVALPLLFSATENRLLQQTVSIVEQNGMQVLQNTSRRIRNAERIIRPLPGQTGSVLVVETSSGALNPVIIGMSSGTLVIIERTTRQTISSTQVAVQDFVVRNTSISASRQSVRLAFRVSRNIRLQRPHIYAKSFETAFHLHPDDVVTPSGCTCTVPACQGNNVYGWQVCQSGACLAASSPLACP